MHVSLQIKIMAKHVKSYWLETVGSRIIYKLDLKNLILYVLPIENILGKWPEVLLETIQIFLRAS